MTEKEQNDRPAGWVTRLRRRLSAAGPDERTGDLEADRPRADRPRADPPEPPDRQLRDQQQPHDRQRRSALTPAPSVGTGDRIRGPAPAGTEASAGRAADIPIGVRIATEWSWRLLVIAAALAVLMYAVFQLRVIVVPVLIALLLTALVVPLTDAIARSRVPRGLAAGLTLVAVLLVVGGLLTLVGQQVATGLQDLVDQVVEGIDQIRVWLVTGPLELSDQEITDAFDEVRNAIGDTSRLTEGALAIGTTLGHVLTGFFVALFATFFMLYEGERIWSWVVRLFPRTARARADSSGRRGWVSLTAFVRATVVVAFVDAVGIMAMALILRVPLAVPIGVLVFLGAFVPIVGALISGSVAVLVALVTHGPVVAVLMLGGVLLVQQLESHVLQPFLLGRLVRLHPLAVILSIAAGVFLAGVPGALFAVPFVAILNAIALHLAEESRPDVEPVVPDD